MSSTNAESSGAPPRLRGGIAVSRRVSIVEAFPDLRQVVVRGASAPSRDSPSATRAIRCIPVVRLRQGRWETAADVHRLQGGIGFVLLDGALLRQVSSTRTGAELLGPGDVLRPTGAPQDEWPFAETWRAVVPTLLGVLDSTFAQRAGPSPDVSTILAARAIRRSETLARQVVIAQVRSVDERVLLILRALTDRWGCATSDAMILPSFLSQGILAMLVGARRPTVTAAVGRLKVSGELARLSDGRWLLPTRC